MRNMLPILARLPIRTLCFISRTVRFWFDAESLVRELRDYASLSNTMPMAPDETGLHLQSKWFDVQYRCGVSRKGVAFESIRVARDGKFRFRVSYGPEGVTVLERLGTQPKVPPRLGRTELSLFLDLRDLVRKQLDHRTRDRWPFHRLD